MPRNTFFLFRQNSLGDSKRFELEFLKIQSALNLG